MGSLVAFVWLFGVIAVVALSVLVLTGNFWGTHLVRDTMRDMVMFWSFVAAAASSLIFASLLIAYLVIRFIL